MSYTISIPYKESADFSPTGNANFTGTSLELAKEDKLIEFKEKDNCTVVISGSHTYVIEESIDKLLELQNRL